MYEALTRHIRSGTNEKAGLSGRQGAGQGFLRRKKNALNPISGGTGPPSWSEAKGRLAAKLLPSCASSFASAPPLSPRPPLSSCSLGDPPPKQSLRPTSRYSIEHSVHSGHSPYLSPLFEHLYSAAAIHPYPVLGSSTARSHINPLASHST